MDTHTLRFFRQFVYSLAAFVLTFIISFIGIAFLSDYPLNTARIIVALAPLIPIGFMIFFFMKYLSNIDELQQRIQLLAIGFSAGTTAMLTFLYGFLEVIGFPSMSLMIVFPIMVLLWGMGWIFISQRYK